MANPFMTQHYLDRQCEVDGDLSPIARTPQEQAVLEEIKRRGWSITFICERVSPDIRIRGRGVDITASGLSSLTLDDLGPAPAER